MVMWSRRWAAGEATKDVLHGILEDAAKNAATAPPKSTDRLIGDYYAACMDQKAIDALGIKALAREMAWIHSVASTEDLQPVIQKLNEEAIYVPFIFGSSQDPHNPQSVIADAGAAGIGLPERDYYFKDDAKSKETREKYLQHIAAMFVLAGTDKETSAANAKIVMRMETAFAGASLNNVELRDPHATDHKMTLDEVQKLTPGFNWGSLFRNAEPRSKRSDQRRSAEIPRGISKATQRNFGRRLESLSDLARLAFRRAFALDAVRSGKFRVLSKNICKAPRK